MEFGLASANTKFENNLHKITFTKTASAEAEKMGGFLTENLFKASTMPVPEKEGEAVIEVNEPKGDLASAVLIGTSPGLGAWLQSENKVTYFKTGEQFDEYKLSDIYYNKAIFVHNENSENEVTKYLYYQPNVAVASKPKDVPSKAKSVEGNPDMKDKIQGATDGKDGVVARDVVNQLMMNPFDEMNKFRMRPKMEKGQSIGIEVQWMDKNSILKNLGVIEKDVVKSVNGIEIKNMGDVANAINSLMGGERFDVEVLRGGNPTKLTYVVK